MIRFTLPDFTLGLRRNLVFLSLMRDSPQFFLPGVRVDSVYGCFPDCKLNGGRAYIRQRYTPEQMDATFSTLDEFGVKVRLTLTNMLAGEAELDDPYVGEMLDVALAHRAELIVYSDVVDAYVRRRWEQAGVPCVRVLSTTREILEPDALNEALGRFSYVVLNYNKNKDHAFLAQVEHPERLEVMANELCNPGCPHRTEHYLHNSRDQLAGTITEFRRCNLAGHDFWREAPASPTILTNDDVYELNRRYGIEYFKLVGRGVDSSVTLESYLYYLVRPEHRAGLRGVLAGMLGMGSGGSGAAC